MRITTLIYSVVFIAMGVPMGSLFAQSTAAPGPQPESAQIVAPAKVKRNLNPESIKRAKLTRLRKDVVLTDDQATKVKPIIDAYVNETQAIKSDMSLDSRTRRQKVSELRQRYENDLNAVLNAEQQQKLASVRMERRARLRDARAGTASGPAEPSGPKVTPAVIQ
jgi:hypothetical protein